MPPRYTVHANLGLLGTQFWSKCGSAVRQLALFKTSRRRTVAENGGGSSRSYAVNEQLPGNVCVDGLQPPPPANRKDFNMTAVAGSGIVSNENRRSGYGTAVDGGESRNFGNGQSQQQERDCTYKCATTAAAAIGWNDILTLVIKLPKRCRRLYRRQIFRRREISFELLKVSKQE